MAEPDAPRFDFDLDETNAVLAGIRAIVTTMFGGNTPRASRKRSTPMQR